MAAPVGLKRDDVIETAVRLLSSGHRISTLGLKDVAEVLNVKVPSLYAHIEGAPGLRHALAIRSFDATATVVRAAVEGRHGIDAFSSALRAYCEFAIGESGLYEASLVSPVGDDELTRAVAGVTGPFESVLRSFGLGDEPIVHWLRLVFATVYGVASLHRFGHMRASIPPEGTLDLLVRSLEQQLAVMIEPVGK